MKSLNIALIVGALAVAGVGGWYMYMQSTPQYQKAAQRGLDPALFSPSAAAAPSQAVSGAPAAAPTAAPATIAAPAEPATVPAH